MNIKPLSNRSSEPIRFASFARWLSHALSPWGYIVKKTKLTVLFFTVIILASACSSIVKEVSPHQNRFYLSSQGNDDNPGTIELPWRTLGKVNSHKLAPGDSVFFARRSSFSGGLLITESGTEDKPIAFTAYGAGTAPRFTNPDLSVLNGNMIQIRGSHILVDGLHFHSGVAADQERGVNARQIGAVFITLGADHNTVKNCEMEDCPIGVQSYGQYNLITRNHIHDCNCFLSDPNWGSIGIMVATSNHEISYNRITNYTVSGGIFGADGGAIEIDNKEYANDSINIHHNWSSGNEGFLEIIGDTPSTENVRVAYNVSDDYQQFIFFWSGKNCYVENNTVLCLRPQNSRVRVVFSFNEGNNTIRNNIFVLADGLQVFSGENVYGAEYYDQPHDHNLYYSVDGSQVDPCGKPLGEGDKIAAPLFVDLTARDLHLQVNSPAIDAGIDLGYTLDFDNNPIPSGTAPDIGAYEYNLKGSRGQ